MYLKTTYQSEEFNAVHGYQNGNQKIMLIEDNKGYYFVNESVKSNPAFINILDSLNKMDNVNTIDFKINEDGI